VASQEGDEESAWSQTATPRASWQTAVEEVATRIVEKVTHSAAHFEGTAGGPLTGGGAHGQAMETSPTRVHN